MRHYTFENQETEMFAHNKMQEIHKKILEILQNKSEKILIITEKLIFDILSLWSNIEKIENSEIFIKNKKKRGGKLNAQKYISRYE